MKIEELMAAVKNQSNKTATDEQVRDLNERMKKLEERFEREDKQRAVDQAFLNQTYSL